jgi:plastocyanin
MKYALWAFIIIIVLGGAWWLLMPQDSGTGSDTATTSTETAGGDMSGMQGMTGGSETASVDASIATAPTVVVDITGKNFSFSKSEIRVKEGDIVQVNFTSENGTHDWVVDEFGAHTAVVQTGGKSSVTFVAGKKGTFEYYCSVGSHRQMGMVGSLIVE